MWAVVCAWDLSSLPLVSHGAHCECGRQHGAVTDITSLRRLQRGVTAKEQDGQNETERLNHHVQNWKQKQRSKEEGEERRERRYMCDCAGEWHLRVLPTGGTRHSPTCLYPYQNNRATKNRLGISAASSRIKKNIRRDSLGRRSRLGALGRVYSSAGSSGWYNPYVRKCRRRSRLDECADTEK